MPRFFGVCELGRTEDWRAIVGSDKWVPTCSAFELAHKWHGCEKFPNRVQSVLATFGAPFAGLSIRYGMVEMPTFLDTLNAPSRTDLMLYCRTRNKELVVMGVEGKATEPFGPPVRKWVRGGRGNPTPSRARRLRFLSDILGVDIPVDAEFGYQLIHRTACVVSECILHGAKVGLVVVHSFSERNPKNWRDFCDFAKTIGISIDDGDKDVLKGGATLGPKKEVAMHLAWVCDQPVRHNS